MKKNGMKKVFALALTLCMLAPAFSQTAHAAGLTSLHVSIEDTSKDKGASVSDESSKYLTAETPLLVEMVQLLNQNQDDFASTFRSPAMRNLMNEGIRAHKDQNRWAKYVEKMEKHMVQGDEYLNIFGNVDRKLGDLIPFKDYTLAYENTVAGDSGYGATYQIVVTREVERNTFTDVPMTHWAVGPVEYVVERNLFNGTSADSFSPDRTMTRQMLMTVLARMDGADTSETPYDKGMAWAVEKGISDGSDPTANISRQQMLTMLYRYIGSPAVEGDLSAFADADKIADYAVNPMVWAVENEIVTGKADGTLDPHGNATRAQVATILARFVNYNMH